MSVDNKTLGRFDLIGLPPAPRGVPQVEVTFDIDANGIVHVSAKDLGTGKEQSIKITSTTNLSDEEIKRMQKEAESHADEDKKKRDEIELLNKADSLVYSTEKLFTDFEGKVDEKKVKEVKTQVDDLKKLLEAEKKDLDKIKTSYEKIEKDIQALSTELYQKMAAEQQSAQGAAGAQDEEKKGKKEKGEKVVDAEFEEVKEKKK